MTSRILTTHTGSLPRSQALTDLLVARDKGKEIDVDALEAEVDRVRRETVAKQLQTGLDIINDGEVPRVGFSTYVRERISGFGGEGRRKPTLDTLKFPDYAAIQAKQIAVDAEVARVWDTPLAQGEVVYDPERRELLADLDGFEKAVADASTDRDSAPTTFVSAATPGIVAETLLLDPKNPHYSTNEEYTQALADQLAIEYREIVARGHILQLDAPDLAMERVIQYQDSSLDEFLAVVDSHIDAINRAIEGLPKEQVRLHVCWGNWQGPHQDDVPVDVLLPHLYRAKVGGFSIPFANPRHEHEIVALKDHPLPDGAVLLPGVIDVTTNYLEHPKLVAKRIVEAAEAVGDPERVIAGIDCGLATFASYEFVATDVAWAKLRSLVEGAEIASKQLFG